MNEDVQAIRSDSSPVLRYHIAALVIAALYVCHAWIVDYQSDDGFITLRYIRNFLDGHGLVFNPGERVEGYTCFLWIMLLAGLKVVLPSVDLLPLSRITGVALGVMTIFLLYRLSVRVCGGHKLRALIPSAFLAAHSGFAAWGTGGLETTLYALLLLAGVYCYVVYLDSQRLLFGAPLFFGLAALTRPDGLLFFGVTSLHFFVYERIRTGYWFHRRIVTWSLPFLLVFVPFFIWRFSYYGYPVPNTAYAKVGAGIEQYKRGIRHVLGYLQLYAGFVFVPILGLLCTRQRTTWRDYVALLMAVYVAYVVFVGGDGLAFFRFFAYVAPLLYLLVGEGLGALYDWTSRKGRTRAVGVLASLVLLVSVVLTTRQSLFQVLRAEPKRWYEPQSKLYFPGNGNDHSYRWFDNYFVDRLAVAARWLDQNAPDDTLVAATPAGAISYYMRHDLIDMLGLNDEHIAHVEVGSAGSGRAGHEKGDGRYVLSRQPEYILMGNVAVFPWKVEEAMMPELLRLRSEHEIWEQPDFHQDYSFRCIRVGNEGLFQYLAFYERKGDRGA